MKKLVIHIGMGKSASTTIQKSVLGHSTAPVSIGRHKPAVCPALPPFWWRGLVSPREQDVEQTKKILLEKYFTKTNLVVISDEVFSSSAIFLENLLSNLDGFPVQVALLWITRNPADFLESLYNHSMRSRVYAFGVPRLNTEAISRFDYRGGIDLWCRDLVKAYHLGDVNQLNVLLYSQWMQRFEAVLGRENCVSAPFELLKQSTDSFAQQISTVFEMDPCTVAALLRDKKNVTGNRLRDYPFGLFGEKLLKLRFLKLFKLFGVSREGVSRVLVKILGSFLPQKRQRMTDETRSIIEEIYQKF